ncbi:MAG: phosphate acyltransferase PlsX [Deltaproteobacteria bacterium]
MSVVALDAMSGERGPDELVRAAAELSLQASHIELLIVGDVDAITERLSRLPHNPERLDVRPARDSLDEAVRLTAAGEADAVVTAAEVDRAVASCRRQLRLLPGVAAPALGAVFPTALRRGIKADPFSLVLDVGATHSPTADELCRFAELGTLYARAVSQNPRPRVALLAPGGRPGEGPKEIADAAGRLGALPGIDYQGGLDPIDIPKGEADVIVTGGFVGASVLSLLDGASGLVLDLAHYAQKQKLLWRLGVAMLSGGVGQLKRVTDWKQYGGAPLLGFEKLLVRAHPGSGELAIQNACRVAAKAVAADIPAGLAALRGPARESA